MNNDLPSHNKVLWSCTFCLEVLAYNNDIAETYHCMSIIHYKSNQFGIENKRGSIAVNGTMWVWIAILLCGKYIAEWYIFHIAEILLLIRQEKHCGKTSL